MKVRPLNKLVDKHYIFISEYISNGGNGQLAAIIAGYSQKSAKSKASQLLADPLIQEELLKKQEELNEKYQITQEYLIQEYLEMIQYAKEFKEDDSFIIKDSQLWLKATDSIAKMLGLNAPKKVDITSNTPITIQYKKPEE